MSDEEDVIVDGKFVEQQVEVFMYAVTVKQQATVLFLQRVRQWVNEAEGITCAAGSIEVGEAGHRHWQMAIQSIWKVQTFRMKMLKQFPELVGKDTRRGNKYSLALQRKSWHVNVAYCCKMVSDTTPCDEIILKEVTRDDIENARRAYDTVTTDAMAMSTKTWNQKLLIACKTEGCVVYDDFGKCICMRYLQDGKTLPDKYALKRLVLTVQAMSHEADSDERDRIVMQLVDDSRRV